MGTSFSIGSLILVLVLSSCRQVSQECKDPLGCLDILPGKPIVIGVIAATEGESGQAGRETLISIEQVFAQQEDFSGHPFTVIHHGTDCTPGNSRIAASRMSLLVNIAAVISTPCLENLYLVESILVTAGVPYINVFNVAEKAKAVAIDLISAIKLVAVPIQDGSLRIPRQALMDALAEIP